MLNCTFQSVHSKLRMPSLLNESHHQKRLIKNTLYNLHRYFLATRNPHRILLECIPVHLMIRNLVTICASPVLAKKLGWNEI